MAARAASVDTTPVDRATAVEIESAEARAWADSYAAAPREFARKAGLGFRWVGDTLVLSWAASARRYFSRAIGLGVARPATPELLDDILGGWERAGITMFLLQSLPHCAPPEYGDWLRDRGLQRFDAQDRVLRDAAPLRGRPAPPPGRELRIERVTARSADEWSDFLQRVYRLDTGAWLPKLIGRPGWYQYIAREDGEIAGARGMHIGSDGTAWLGMDGPVPGLVTDDYAPDAALCAQIVSDGLARGARRFIADIEARSDAMDTPAYDYFPALGFRIPYARAHYA
jgi:hypothetical protein